MASCQTVVRVVDTTKPTISLNVTPAYLWPPNHNLVPVRVNITATDECTAAPSCKVISVSSNEPIDGLGDGDKTPDWIITEDFTVNLRAERSGTGAGRVYTITVECTDGADNIAQKSIEVKVPRDQGKQ